MLLFRRLCVLYAVFFAQLIKIRTLYGNRSTQCCTDDVYCTLRDSLHRILHTGHGGAVHSYKCEFEDVLGEADGVQSMDCVWSNSYKCFNCWKSLCYTIATLFCGICYAAYWGCAFAETAFYHIWVVTPCLKLCTIQCVVFRKVYMLCIDCCVGPMCETCGLLLSKIKISKG